jgi:hypothetical protein
MELAGLRDVLRTPWLQLAQELKAAWRAETGCRAKPQSQGAAGLLPTSAGVRRPSSACISSAWGRGRHRSGALVSSDGEASTGEGRMHCARRQAPPGRLAGCRPGVKRLGCRAGGKCGANGTVPGRKRPPARGAHKSCSAAARKPQSNYLLVRRHVLEGHVHCVCPPARRSRHARRQLPGRHGLRWRRQRPEWAYECRLRML